jgi:hypothetical protein
MIKVLGPDMITEEHVSINKQDDPKSVDIGAGKYSVTVITGPSYTTQRVEAREEMMALGNAMPDTFAVAADLIVEAQDWPGSEKIAARLRSRLPPGMIDPKDMDDEARAQQAQQQQAQQKQQQMQDQIAQLEMAGKQAEIELKQGDTKLRDAQVRKAEAEAQRAEAEAQLAIAQAHKAMAEIGQEDRRIRLDAVERLNPLPAGNGAQA